MAICFPATADGAISTRSSRRIFSIEGYRSLDGTRCDISGARRPGADRGEVAGVIQTFLTKWHADEVAMIGYSFGADVIPFAYNRLPETLRDHVVLIALLGFSKSADFESRLADGWASRPGPTLFLCYHKRSKFRRN